MFGNTLCMHQYETMHTTFQGSRQWRYNILTVNLVNSAYCCLFGNTLFLPSQTHTLNLYVMFCENDLYFIQVLQSFENIRHTTSFNTACFFNLFIRIVFNNRKHILSSGNVWYCTQTKSYWKLFFLWYQPQIWNTTNLDYGFDCHVILD